jgi:hypothetical protein
MRLGGSYRRMVYLWFAASLCVIYLLVPVKSWFSHHFYDGGVFLKGIKVLAIGFFVY